MKILPVIAAVTVCAAILPQRASGAICSSTQEWTACTSPTAYCGSDESSCHKINCRESSSSSINCYCLGSKFSCIDEVIICNANCPPDSWESYDTSHERRATYSPNVKNYCSCALKKYIYRCKAGYYGDMETDDAGTCTRCPSMTDSGGTARYGMNTAGANANVTSCLMSSSYTFSDGAGTYKFGADCQYAN
ncbi:MAG: hypothetical protein LBK26_00400 [Rickettsiales bacterium]|jgi:hypothetical protein|nr:hypothetical protein [Rickettsiales bacterium]